MNERVGRERGLYAGKVFLTSAALCGALCVAGCGSSKNGGAGGGGGTITPSGALAPGGAASIYTFRGLESGGSVIQVFSAGVTGSFSPTSTLVNPADQLGALAVDTSGQLYVSALDLTTGADEIFVFAAEASGADTPVRTIVIDPNYPIIVNSMTLDAAGRLYVAGWSGGAKVEMFPAGANGMVTPTTVLTYPFSTVDEPVEVAVDRSGKIYMSNVSEKNGQVTDGQILVFAAGAKTGDAPVETISTVAATATTQSRFTGLTVDASGNIFAVEDSFTLDASGSTVTSASAQIVEFAPGATGIATPVKAITSTEAGTVGWNGLQLDAAGNLYTASEVVVVGESVEYSLLGFGPSASGSVASGVTITPSVSNVEWGDIAVH
jgi:hypothetical protein